MKFQIIDQLEGRYAPNPRGEYFLCKDRYYHLPHHIVQLHLYETGQLEVMLEKSMSAEEYNTMRLMLLHEEQIMNEETQEADEWFKRLPPKAQKQVVRRAHQSWYNDQQIALAVASGDY